MMLSCFDLATPSLGVLVDNAELVRSAGTEGVLFEQVLAESVSFCSVWMDICLGV